MNVWWMPVLAVATAIVVQAGTRRWWVRRSVARLGAFEASTTARSALRRIGTVVTRAGAWLAARRRRRPSLAEDVAPTLHELARATAAGSTLTAAMAELPEEDHRPFAATLRRALDAHALGASLADSIAHVSASPPGPARRVWSPGRHLAGASRGPEGALGLSVLELAARHGGATAASLDRTASAIRERRAVIAERAVQSAQARLSTVVLSALPAVFAGWTAMTDRRVAGFLVGSALGWACLTAGLALNIAGWAWMRRIVRGRP